MAVTMKRAGSSARGAAVAAACGAAEPAAGAVAAAGALGAPPLLLGALAAPLPALGAPQLASSRQPTSQPQRRIRGCPPRRPLPTPAPPHFCIAAPPPRGCAALAAILL